MGIAPAMIVVLHLIVWDADSGTKLFESEPDLTGGFSISGARIEDCRLYGIDVAKKLTAKYRVQYPNAFTNVDCEWTRGRPA